MSNRLAFENTRALRDLQGNRGLGELLLTWNGAKYKYTPGSLQDAAVLSAGGLGPDISAVFICVKDDFATLPTPHQTLTAGGIVRKIKTVTVSADQSHIVIACVDRSQGA